ncbi:hypothetical protein CU254_00465 [Amycolatopsis sp. AA4]|nr:hypothetical protein CU254_00465 [Amycolatopsis sp. AA4]
MNLSKAEYETVGLPDRAAYTLVYGTTLVALFLAGVSFVLTALGWLSFTGVSWSPSDQAFGVTLGVYFGFTGLLGLLLIRAFVLAVRLNDGATVANVQSALWKFFAYWLIVIAGLVLARAFDSMFVCVPGTCPVPDPKALARAATVPALLAVSIGFIPVLVDARKEVRTGQARAAQSAPAPQPVSVTVRQRSHGASVIASAGVVAVVAAVMWARAKR